MLLFHHWCSLSEHYLRNPHVLAGLCIYFETFFLNSYFKNTKHLQGSMSLYRFFLRFTSFSPSEQEYCLEVFKISLKNFNSWIKKQSLYQKVYKYQFSYSFGIQQAGGKKKVFLLLYSFFSYFPVTFPSTTPFTSFYYENHHTSYLL